jgi:hypothetical protein
MTNPAGEGITSTASNKRGEKGGGYLTKALGLHSHTAAANRRRGLHAAADCWRAGRDSACAVRALATMNSRI